MRGVGPGTVLGGRYTVRQRVEQVRDTERWTADDTTLGRTVSILVVSSDDPRTAALLDAARRAASVAHSVFVRILDVGTDAEVAYVVEEDLAEARTLGAIVGEGGIPADEVRRITGEAAAALESARQRGMHHLDLTPDDVLRTPEGEVRLRGLEIAAVRAGQEAADPDDAARRDAVGVVALAYAGLTGLWPLGAGGCGLPAAPRVPDGVASPSEIAAGVPRDLDALCRLTLNDDQGPTSPGDYARQVAPWPSRQVVGRPVTPMAPVRSTDDQTPGPDRVAPAPPPSGAGGTPAPGTGPADGAARGPAPSTGAEEGSGPSSPTEPEPRRHGAAATAGLAGAAAAAGAAAGAAARTDPSVDASAGTRAGGAWPAGVDTRPPDWLSAPTEDAVRTARREPPPGWLSEPRPGERGSAEYPAPTHHDPTEDRALVPHDDRTLVHDDLEQDGEGRGSSAERAGALAAGAGAAVAGALGTVGGKVSTFARRAVDKVSEISPDTQRGERDHDADLEAPAPMVPAEPLTKDESKLALFIVAAFVIFALVIGIYGVSRIGKGSTNIFGPATGPLTRTTTVAPSTSGSNAAGGSAGAAEPLAILKVQAYDPLGDGREHDELTGKVYDGNPDTGWYTESYSSSNFGGLKSGVGLVVDLGPNKKPQKVELTIPNKSALEVWVGPDPTLDGATKVGEKDPAEGNISFDVPEDVSGQYIILWYTKVYPDAKGDIRGWLNEVVVDG